MKKLECVGVIETNEAYLKVLYWFFSFPSLSIGLGELAKNLKISKATANRAVLKLSREGFLEVEEIGKAWRIKCNLKHKFNKLRKIGYNLFLIANSGILGEINKNYRNALAVVLFGSYSKGDDNEESDIDIAVEIVDKKELRIEELGVIEEFGFRKNVRVNLHIFSREKIDINLFSNIANGIIIEGYLEVRK